MIFSYLQALCPRALEVHNATDMQQIHIHTQFYSWFTGHERQAYTRTV